MKDINLEAKQFWYVVVATSPVTKLVAESWLNTHSIDRSRVICLSRRGFVIPDCSHIIEVKDRHPGCGKFEWLKICAFGSVSIFKQVRKIIGKEQIILLKPGLIDPREHLLHLSRQCAGVYYAEEGSYSHLHWEAQRAMSLHSWIVRIYAYLLLGRQLIHLRFSELFMIEARRVLGCVAISKGAFPERENIEVLNIPRIIDNEIEAVFLGDPYVEVHQISQNERDRWLMAVRNDLKTRKIRKLGIRVHPSETIFSYEDYKAYFEYESNGEMMMEAYKHPVDVVTPSLGTPLYQVNSTAAIYGKESGFEVISMDLIMSHKSQGMLKHIAASRKLLDSYVDVWL